MRNPYKIDPPFVVSFSGGRTSAFMLRKILDAHAGLPDGGYVLFANTGKEHEATLAFVDACARNWGVEIHWLEYSATERYSIRSLENASRNGEPFEAMLAKKKRLPSPPRRFCTTELKLKPISAFLRDRRAEDATMAVGLRADEPHRVHRLKGRIDSMFSHSFPLYDSNITREDVIQFWREQPFDLALPPDSPFINCDMCFLKRMSVVDQALEQEPQRAGWWLAQEEKYGQRFRLDRPNLRQRLVQIRVQGKLFAPVEDSGETDIACNCTD